MISTRGSGTGNKEKHAMNDYRQDKEPCGIRLMRLMDTRLFEIVRKEHGNERIIHLYGIGEYWAAFEQSAYLLCRVFPKTEISVVTHAAYPFPVVMAGIADRELTDYSRRHIFKRDETDYKELITAEISRRHYQIWHRNEVQGFL